METATAIDLAIAREEGIEIGVARSRLEVIRAEAVRDEALAVCMGLRAKVERLKRGRRKRPRTR